MQKFAQEKQLLKKAEFLPSHIIYNRFQHSVTFLTNEKEQKLELTFNLIHTLLLLSSYTCIFVQCT